MSVFKKELIKVTILGLGSAFLWILYAYFFYKSSKLGLGKQMELFCLAVSGFSAILTYYFSEKFRSCLFCLRREKQGFDLVFYKKEAE